MKKIVVTALIVLSSIHGGTAKVQAIPHYKIMIPRIPIAPALPKKSGYRRSFFGRAWTDKNNTFLGHNHCDTRDDILRLYSVTPPIFKQGNCKIATTTIYDPYSGVKAVYVRKRNNGIDIDHIVPLKWAWRTGAQHLTLMQRTDLANDPLNLVPVSSHWNRQKGPAPVDAWLPPNKAFRCEYAARYAQVKAKYHLWVTSSENNTLQRFRSRC